MTNETSKVARIGGEEEAGASSHSQQLTDIAEDLQGASSSAASPPRSGDAMAAAAAAVRSASGPHLLAEEVGEATTETERKKEEELRKANEQKAKLQDIEFGGVAAVFSLAVMMSGFFLSSQAKGRQTLYLKISMFLAFSSFVSGFSFMLLSMQLFSAKEDHISGFHLHRAISRCLFYACSVLPALTILSLLLVMPYSTYIYFGFAILAVIAVPVSLMHCYVSRKAEKAKATDIEVAAAAGAAPDVDMERQKKEMESSYKITSAIASMSFAGLVGVLIGVYKGIGGGGDISGSVHIVIMCMFSTSMLSMLLMMLWMKVLKSENPKLGKFFVRTISRVNAALLVLLAVAAFAASFGILKWYMLSAFVPLALAAIVRFVIQHCTTQQNVVRAGDNETQLKWMADMASKLTAWSLGIVMAIYGGFLGDDDKTHDKMVILKICIFLPTTAFASSLGVIYLTMRPGGESAARDSSKAAMNILACSAMVLFSAAMLIIYIVEVMKS